MPYIDFSKEIPPNIYKMLIGSVVPRPIAWVSSLSENGIPNLAPFSYFNIASINPPILSFSPLNAPTGHLGESRRKDTLQNVRATGQCVIHIVPHALQDQMNLSAANWSPEVDEFEKTGLARVNSLFVKPQRIESAPIAFECEVDQIVSWGDQPMGGNVVFCRVLMGYFADYLFQDYKINLALLDPVSRLGGPDYSRVKTDVYALPRPEDLI
ncbi:MAG TPA: flavin reductase family protein [Rhodothermales bacterium]|nr:flavin reductase family protein [Rhodothermales bacterium]HRR08061.1 flavin reductase family protein [Rhodothermales bacterium]